MPLSLPRRTAPAPAGTSAGAPGPPGPQGPQGPAGPEGPAGAAGAAGAQGPAGVAGAQGPQGPAGAAGAKGDTGAVGAVGAQGPKGDTGAAGAQGPQGPAGPTGSGWPMSGAVVTIPAPTALNTPTSLAVTFPAGRFSAAPIVTATASGGSPQALDAVTTVSVTATGCVLYAARESGGLGTVIVGYQAIQMLN
jgi:hypothetical protein